MSDGYEVPLYFKETDLGEIGGQAVDDIARLRVETDINNVSLLGRND